VADPFIAKLFATGIREQLRSPKLRLGPLLISWNELLVNTGRYQMKINGVSHWVLAAIVLASSVSFSGAQPAPAAPKPAGAAQAGVPASQPSPPWQGSQINRLTRRAELFYESFWGVGELRVKAAESGEIIRFNYRVLDPNRAAALNDKKAEPELIDQQAGVKLVIPQMEKIGKLRQSSTPKPGMTYWMAFSNPTRAVKRGHRVDVTIGQFRANGLVVE
jgi:hypothetical protein